MKAPIAMMRTILIAAVGAAVLAACGPSAEVVRLVNQATVNEEILAQEHQRAMENQDELVSAIPGQYRAVSKAMYGACQARVDARVEALRARIDSEAERLKNRFETKAWQLVNQKFPAALEDGYWAPVLAQGEKEKANLEALAQQKEKFPIDAKVVEAYNKKYVQVLSFSIDTLNGELELRDKLLKSLQSARNEIGRMIQDRLAPVRRKLDAQAKDACGAPRAVPEKIEKIRADLERLSDPIARLHQAQKEALKTIGRFINRKSPVELVVVGAGEAVVDKIPGLRQKAERGIMTLGSLAGDVGKELLPAALGGLDVLENELNRAVDKVTGGIDAKLAAVFHGLGFEKKAAETISGAIDKFTAAKGE